MTRPELAAAGVSPEEIKQRVKRGTLLRVHRGVYRVGHAAPSREARYLAAVRACGEGAVLRAGLPLPRTNRPAGGRRVDACWPERRLTIELDSYRFHGSRHAWEQDRRREREAHARGDEFRRYTYGDVLKDPALMLAELRGLLQRGCGTTRM